MIEKNRFFIFIKKAYSKLNINFDRLRVLDLYFSCRNSNTAKTTLFRARFTFQNILESN